jgi:hypothetical protein
VRFTSGTAGAEYAVVTVSPDAGVDVTEWTPFPDAG